MFVAPSTAYACKCKFPPDAKTAAPYASDIFEAVAAGEPVASPPENLPRTATYTFEVGRVMKGAAAGTVEITTNLSSAACGRSYEPGQTYLIYAKRGERGLTDGACSFTASKSKASSRGDYTFWGDGPPPAPAPTTGEAERPRSPEPAPVDAPLEPTSPPKPTKHRESAAAESSRPSGDVKDRAAPTDATSAKGCAVTSATRSGGAAAWMWLVVGGVSLRRRRRAA